MIFFFDSKGNLARAFPESIKQGSNRSNRIWLFMPTSSENVVNAYFTLPNGEIAKPTIMTGKQIIDDLEIDNLVEGVDFDKKQVACWFCDVTRPITRYAGNLLVQFHIASDDETITTESIEIPIVRGVVPSLKEDETFTYEQVMEFIATLKSAYTTDNTLTLENVPADAKAVGNKFEQVETKTQELTESVEQIKIDLTKINKLTKSVVDVLPEVGEENVLYLVPNTNLQDSNIKDEYLWLDGKWELIGSTAIDLTEYQKKTDESLETENKTIVGAINEVNLKAGQGGGSDLDVQINGTSIVQDGVANINSNELVKQGITTNTLILEDGEKASACDWLGAMKKPNTDKGTEYVVMIDNKQEVSTRIAATYANQAQIGRIPIFSNANWEQDYENVPISNMGWLVANTPIKNYQVANKKYVDELMASAGGTQLYKHDMTINGNTKLIFISTQTTAFTSVQDALDNIFDNGLESLAKGFGLKDGSIVAYYHNFAPTHFIDHPTCSVMDNDKGINEANQPLLSYISTTGTIEEYAPIPL
jgi:hypothetical protein